MAASEDCAEPVAHSPALIGSAPACQNRLAALVTESERQPVEVEGTVFHVPVGPRVCVQQVEVLIGRARRVIATEGFVAQRRPPGFARDVDSLFEADRRCPASQW